MTFVPEIRKGMTFQKGKERRTVLESDGYFIEYQNQSGRRIEPVKDFQKWLVNARRIQ